MMIAPGRPHEAALAAPEVKIDRRKERLRIHQAIESDPFLRELRAVGHLTTRRPEELRHEAFSSILALRREGTITAEDADILLREVIGLAMRRRTEDLILGARSGLIFGLKGRVRRVLGG